MPTFWVKPILRTPIVCHIFSVKNPFTPTFKILNYVLSRVNLFNNPHSTRYWMAPITRTLACLNSTQSVYLVMIGFYSREAHTGPKLQHVSFTPHRSQTSTCFFTLMHTSKTRVATPTSKTKHLNQPHSSIIILIVAATFHYNHNN